MINLSMGQIMFLKEHLKMYFADSQYFIFGSRSQNNNKIFSDVDIAIKSKSIIDIMQIEKFKELINTETNFPFMIDVIDLRNIDEKFYRNIESDLRKI